MKLREVWNRLSQDMIEHFFNVIDIATVEKAIQEHEEMTAWIRTQAMALNPEVNDTWSIHYCIRVLSGFLGRKDDSAELTAAYAKIGKLSAENDRLLDSERKRNEWLYKAKQDAGYNQNTTFDDVWKDALTALKEKDCMP